MIFGCKRHAVWSRSKYLRTLKTFIIVFLLGAVFLRINHMTRSVAIAIKLKNIRHCPFTDHHSTLYSVKCVKKSGDKLRSIISIDRLLFFSIRSIVPVAQKCESSIFLRFLSIWYVWYNDSPFEQCVTD